MTLQDIAVVGAGISGLICARRLQHAGYRVRVLEKSRGLGGRLATRRLDGAPLDHGARYWQPAGEMSLALTRRLVDQDVLTPWRPQTFTLTGTGTLTPTSVDHSTYYVAPAGMSAVGKAIAADMPILRQQRVIQVAPTDDQTWRIVTERTGDGEPSLHLARALVLALPAPQIVPLLAPLQSQSAIAARLSAIAAVTYAPCITVMAQYAPHTPRPCAPLPDDPTSAWMVEGQPDTPFFWVGLDSSKRSVESVSVVFHSSARFANSWLDASNLQPAGEALMAEAARLIAPWLAKPIRWQVHRWRYALVETACSLPSLADVDPAPWVACGDWCGDRAIDTALDSGWAAAAQVNTLLDGASLSDFPTELL